MKFSVATILALAAAAVASPTPGGGWNDWDDGRFGNVYCTDRSNSIIDVDLNVDIRNRINSCNRGSIYGDGWWGEGYGRGLRYDCDEYRRGHNNVYGIWGCTRPCDGYIDNDYCTRFDGGW